MASTWRPGLLIGLAYLGFVGLGVRSGVFGIAWPSIRADFDLSLDALGALLGPGSVGYLVGSFVSGRSLARWALGMLLAAGFASVAIYLVGTALAPTWWLLLAMGLPGGLGAGLVDAALNTYVANRHGPREMNWLHASWGVGATLSPFLMTAAIDSGLGWRWGYGVSGVLLLVLSLGCVLTRAVWPTRAELVHPDRPAASSQRSPETTNSRGPSMRQTLSLSVTWLSALLFIAYTGVELGIGQWAFQLLVTARGMGTVEAGAAVSTYWASMTLGRFFFGGIVALIGVERLLQLCLLSVLVGLGLLWVPTLPAVAFVALALLGVVQAPVYPALVTLTPSHFGSAHTANAVGFQVAASVVGGTALPALMGVMAQAFGLETIVRTLIAAAILQIVSYFAWSRTHRS